MRHARALVISWLAASLCLAFPAAAQQDDPAMRSAGRKLALDGIALFQQGKAPEASEKLEKAFQLLPVPSVALWSARALEKRGLLVEASERYMEAGRMSGFKGDQDVQLQAQKDAARELEALAPRIPSLVIAVSPAGADQPVVMLDGKLVPPALLGEEQPVNPGAHQIDVTLGQRKVSRRITLAEAERKTETIGPASEAQAPSSSSSSPISVAGDPSKAPDTGPGSSSTQRTVAYVALAAGGAGLALGGVSGVLALSKRGSLEDNPGCDASNNVCLPSQRSEVESLDTLRTLSSVGLIAGGVLATTGVVLLLTSKPKSSASAAQPQLALRLAPRSLTFSGTFQ
jgi:tetratricopeptide (TPR) repeat protein